MSIKLALRNMLLDNFFVKRLKYRALMVVYGAINFQGLVAGVQLDLFTLLAKRGPMHRSEIAKALGIPEKSTRNLLTLLVSTGILNKRRGRSEDPIYYNTFLGKHYLNRNSPLQITSIIVGWLHFISYKAMYHYYESLKAGKNIGLEEIAGTEPTLYQRLAHNPELEKHFQDAMHQLSNIANQWIAEYVDFSSSRHLLDVGGGDGSNLCTILKRHPNIKGTVFDSKTVAERAKINISREGLTQRIDTFGGDCFVDPFPIGPDTILFCHFLDIWSEEQDRALIQKAYDCLPRGGKVIIFDIMEWDESNGPLSAVITSAYFLTQATGNGYMYAAREYESWLRDAGFKNMRRMSLPDEHIAIVAEK